MEVFLTCTILNLPWASHRLYSNGLSILGFIQYLIIILGFLPQPAETWVVDLRVSVRSKAYPLTMDSRYSVKEERLGVGM